MEKTSFVRIDTLEVGQHKYRYYQLAAIEGAGLGSVERLPYSLRVILEAMLRNYDGLAVTREHVQALAAWDGGHGEKIEIPFAPGRVVLQDFTGVPCVVDLAAMRDAVKKLGGDPACINPEVQCDLVIDHSVQVDDFAHKLALSINAEKEFERNNERYRFLKWGQQSLQRFRVVPPATGIVHQVNLEYLASVALQKQQDGVNVVFPDSLVGTDSHTTMINGLGVVGWGVGGIEAEAVMLGQPIYMLTPEVVGFKLKGRLPQGTTATDLVLTITQILRAHGVVEKFVEFFGSGMADLSLPDRATIANMAPEYGATMGFFPIDDKTIDYLRFTGRSNEQVALVEAYAKANHLYWTESAEQPVFTDVLELDLSSIKPCLAGPKRPQDRVALDAMQKTFRRQLTAPAGPQGLGVSAAKVNAEAVVEHGEQSHAASSEEKSVLKHGAVVIAAITSCTNTSNPDVMIAAGLVARKARQRGLTRKPWVKTSLAPGSKVVTDYLDAAGLSDDLNALGFHTVGYGCTTCIGNSGPLPSEIDSAVRSADLVVASVLSGNRNFEGRVHPSVRANYLASPPLVVAYALAGTVDLDLSSDALAHDTDGKAVFLRDIWPTQEEIQALRTQCVKPEQFKQRYAAVFTENQTWNQVPVSSSELYPWDADSSYVQQPPFFAAMPRERAPVQPIHRARCLLLLGDSVTTDHISPAGSIAENSAAAEFLRAHGVEKKDFNSYGSRRGNDKVMTRGTFANVRVRNRLAVDVNGTLREGGYTRDMSTQGQGQISSVFAAAENYRTDGTPLVVLAGKDYGMGSSRDWAAKGTSLLGVRAVIATSFERIHRSNLVFMGVLPLQLGAESIDTIKHLDGSELFSVDLPSPLTPGCFVQVKVEDATGKQTLLTCRCRIDTAVEVEYFENGGILQTVIRKKLSFTVSG